MRIEVAEHADALSHGVAEQFVRLTTEAVEARGRCAVALSGGSTPKNVYQLLAAPAFRSRVRWGDDSFLLGRRASCAAGSSGQQLPDGGGGDAVEGARPAGKRPSRHVVSCLMPNAPRSEYEETIRACVSGEPMPRFDLIHLGIGTDGHTASLFPGSAALDERRAALRRQLGREIRWLSHHVDAADLERGTRRHVHRDGAAKAPIVQQVLRGSATQRRPFPRNWFDPMDGECWWMLDQAAAGELT